MKNTISHLYKTDDGQWVIQSNEEHTAGVAARAAEFADEFGMASWGKALGLLHDKGKESKAFQQHIKKESGYDPYAIVNGNYHHAYVGGVIAHHLWGKGADNFIVNPIVSHHTGLHDSDELTPLLQQSLPNEISLDIVKPALLPPPFEPTPKDLHHIVRVLFSCLVDADYLDTEAFMDKESAALRANSTPLSQLLPRLLHHLQQLRESAQASTVNEMRRKVQERCEIMTDSPIGFYSLTVPTGGGKTLSSLLWAMRHAIRNGQRRIIIAIPYTSIIVQTAAILRHIFGPENVLEHHSNTDADAPSNESLQQKFYLATENWDYPLIVTTNVQLFESMFSNRPSKCRRLHNIVNSVIILDEVQTLPTDYLQPIVDSLNTYNQLFKTSVLFTTASQPVLSGLIEGCSPKAAFKGLGHITEIIPTDYRLHDKLRRVQLQIDNEGKTYDEMATQLLRHKRVLCIVNTRRDAKELFNRLPQEGVTLHLSKNMCAAHINKVIEQMKEALTSSTEIVRVVSTQLIEAGVDIDFPVVYRQEAGLDSVLQAAGRCNREGKRTLSTTYVFSLSKEHALPPGEMQAANNARLSLKESLDWFAPETMTQYFKQLYCRKNTFDAKNIKSFLYPITDMLFATAAKEFNLIENQGKPVIVCYNDSMKWVDELLQKGPSYSLMKRLAKYTVNIYQHDFEALQRLGVIEEKLTGIFVVPYKEQYNDSLGLCTNSTWQEETLII